jgi:hypothetical protein
MYLGSRNRHEARAYEAKFMMKADLVTARSESLRGLLKLGSALPL